ncbi:MAG: hypothetical protein KJ052_17680 [Candidatus Hydrogenedentes bacterium]|nr:hypothetical protein [Candidatus Hydrogenedentota bacterium]
MIPEHYVWFVWSAAFLIPWAVLYLCFPQHRKAMLWGSVFTTPFGLTEPLFVPEYWNPPSLFHLAQRTGFDLESLVFCFGIGGVGAVLYNVLTNTRTIAVPERDRCAPRHRFHYLALFSPFLTFVLLAFLPWNAIYPGVIAMFVGAAATMHCRPDLLRKTWVGGLIFLTYYFVYFLGLRLIEPGYVEKVWQMERLTGVLALGIPIEELVFALGFGLYWSGVYEHFTWRQPLAPERAPQRTL